MRTDDLVLHADDMGNVVGAFYDSPIVEASMLKTELREMDDVHQRVRLSLGMESAPIELLPNEVITGRVIRRDTTAESIGFEEFYAADIPEGTRVTLCDSALRETGVLVTWRPNNEDFAVIHEEVAL